MTTELGYYGGQDKAYLQREDETVSQRILLLVIIACTSLWANTGQAALDELTISELSAIDQQYMAGARNSLQEKSASYLGRSFSGDRDRDIEILQTLLDKGLVRNHQTKELQAMGIVLGDLLLKELGMKWVIYEDKAGRTRALRLNDTDTYLFPVTMIARRREVGNTASVESIYKKAVATIKRRQAPLPFQ
ncbi:MAG: DUF3806 domain-containing protein [Halioglobus sp.]